MRDVLTHPNRLAGFGCLPLSVAALLLVVGSTLAQDVNADSAAPGPRPTPTGSRYRATTQPAQPTQVVVFRIEHANVSNLAKVLDGMVPGCRIVADQASSSLFVNGTKESIDQMKKLLGELDQPSKETSPMLKIYQLTNRSANNDLQKDITNLLAPVPGVSRFPTRVVTDPSRDLVIVSGDEKILSLMDVLINTLDKKESPRVVQPTRPDMKIRIVWLMSGIESAALPAAPPDLKDVVAELIGIGVPEPHLAAQFLIRTSSEEGFSMNAPVAILPEQACNLEVIGDHSDWDTDKPTLDLTIRALKISPTASRSSTPPPAGVKLYEELWSIKTTISVPVGQAVVLGVSPTGNTTSAFVVQVLK